MILKPLQKQKYDFKMAKQCYQRTAPFYYNKTGQDNIEKEFVNHYNIAFYSKD